MTTRTDVHGSPAGLHSPVGGRLFTPVFKVLLLAVAFGAIAAAYRFLFGIGAASAMNDGYPWGTWIAIDVVVGTAVGCGGFAVGLVVYILNKGRYHPLVRPAVLTSLLGYALAVLAVTIDLGRFWGLWKVPFFVWRWSHSPQLEVALCVAAYNIVLLIEFSPAVFERWRTARSAALRAVAERGLRWLDRGLVFILALGLLLPTMHQSSLGTMMLLPGPRMHPLWFTPWLPLLFLVNAVLMGFAIVILEATFSPVAFGRPRHASLVASLSRIASGVGVFWVACRVLEVVLSGKAPLLVSRYGAVFVAEIALPLAAAAILMSAERRAQASWQARAAILLVVAGALFRVDTYLVAFNPGSHWSYFPSIPELLITFGIIAGEIALYIAAVRFLPILGEAAMERSRP